MLRNATPWMIAIASMTTFFGGSAIADEASAARVYGEFAAAHFGAEQEPLVYTTFGDTLQILEDSRWMYLSETSATVAFQTNLPARVHIEYGPTAEYGEKSNDSADRHYYTHVRYLTGLKPATTYHYRLVATDERGNVAHSEDQTFTTGLPATAKNVVRVPDDLGEAPYVLDKPNTYYLVTQDITVDGLALDIPERTSNVTVDLGGHVITYNQKQWPDIEGDFHQWIKNAKYGVRVFKAQDFKIYNGTIRQGVGNNAAQANSIGYNPIYFNGSHNMEIAGVTLQYGGPQQMGIYMHWAGENARIHHNVFNDVGTGMINRHGAGSRALLISKENCTVERNLVQRTRQSGLSGQTVRHNEVYIDSWATNSFGVGLLTGGVAEGNRIFGTGYHVVAFGWGKGLTFRDNFVHLEGTPVKGRFSEYGDQISLNGFRLTQYDGATKDLSDNTYYNNTVVVRGRNGSQARGTQFWGDPNVKGLLFHDNTVKAISTDTDSPNIACIVTQGSSRRADLHEPIVYQNATLISNICNVRFGDDYGVGSNSRFLNCTFVRVGDDPRYRTFNFDRNSTSHSHVVRDPIFEGGASMDSVEFYSANQDVTFEWTVTVKTTPGAAVTITDRTGQEVFSGEADDTGSVQVPLAQQKLTRSEKTPLTPHTIRVAADGKTATQQVTADATKAVEVSLR